MESYDHKENSINEKFLTTIKNDSIAILLINMGDKILRKCNEINPGSDNLPPNSELIKIDDSIEEEKQLPKNVKLKGLISSDKIDFIYVRYKHRLLLGDVKKNTFEVIGMPHSMINQFDKKFMPEPIPKTLNYADLKNITIMSTINYDLVSGNSKTFPENIIQFQTNEAFLEVFINLNGSIKMISIAWEEFETVLGKKILKNERKKLFVLQNKKAILKKILEITTPMGYTFKNHRLPNRKILTGLTVRVGTKRAHKGNVFFKKQIEKINFPITEMDVNPYRVMGEEFFGIKNIPVRHLFKKIELIDELNKKKKHKNNSPYTHRDRTEKSIKLFALGENCHGLANLGLYSVFLYPEKFNFKLLAYTIQHSDVRDHVFLLLRPEYSFKKWSDQPLNEYEIAFRYTENGFEYKVIGLDGKEKNGVIPWNKFASIPHTEKEFYLNEKFYLPYLLTLLSEAQHTLPLFNPNHIETYGKHAFVVDSWKGFSDVFNATSGISIYHNTVSPAAQYLWEGIQELTVYDSGEMGESLTERAQQRILNKKVISIWDNNNLNRNKNKLSSLYLPVKIEDNNIIFGIVNRINNLNDFYVQVRKLNINSATLLFHYCLEKKKIKLSNLNEFIDLCIFCNYFIGTKSKVTLLKECYQMNFENKLTTSQVDNLVNSLIILINKETTYDSKKGFYLFNEFFELIPSHERFKIALQLKHYLYNAEMLKSVLDSLSIDEYLPFIHSCLNLLQSANDILYLISSLSKNEQFTQKDYLYFLELIKDKIIKNKNNNFDFYYIYEKLPEDTQIKFRMLFLKTFPDLTRSVFESKMPEHEFEKLFFKSCIKGHLNISGQEYYNFFQPLSPDILGENYGLEENNQYIVDSPNPFATSGWDWVPNETNEDQNASEETIEMEPMEETGFVEETEEMIPLEPVQSKKNQHQFFNGFQELDLNDSSENDNKHNSNK